MAESGVIQHRVNQIGTNFSTSLTPTEIYPPALKGAKTVITNSLNCTQTCTQYPINETSIQLTTPPIHVSIANLMIIRFAIIAV